MEIDLRMMTMLESALFSGGCLTILIFCAYLVRSYYKSRPPLKFTLVHMVNQDLIMSFYLGVTLSLLIIFILDAKLTPLPWWAAALTAWAVQAIGHVFFMYLSVGVVLHYAQVHSRSVSPMAALDISISDDHAKIIIRIILTSASLVTCAIMVYYGATPRFLKELNFDHDASLSSFFILTIENIGLILISITINITLRLLILCEALKTKNYSKLQNKRLAQGLLAISVIAFIVIMLAAVAYQRNYATKGERERMATRRVVFLIVAVLFPASTALSHTRMRRFVIRKSKQKLERLLFEANTVKQKAGKTLAGALVVPYVDSEDGNLSV